MPWKASQNLIRQDIECDKLFEEQASGGIADPMHRLVSCG
jgi:hypothetical protein